MEIPLHKCVDLATGSYRSAAEIGFFFYMCNKHKYNINNITLTIGEKREACPGEI